MMRPLRKCLILADWISIVTTFWLVLSEEPLLKLEDVYETMSHHIVHDTRLDFDERI
jgi:hypothetical protein